MKFNCDLCGDTINILQMSNLCEDCYEIRKIVKLYTNMKVLDTLETEFRNNKRILRVKNETKKERRKRKKKEKLERLKKKQNK